MEWLLLTPSKDLPLSSNTPVVWGRDRPDEPRKENIISPSKWIFSLFPSISTSLLLSPHLSLTLSLFLT